MIKLFRNDVSTMVF